MSAQLVVENPLLTDVKAYEPHKAFATELAAGLPDFMVVVLEPNEDSMLSRLTISVKYTSSIKLGVPIPDVDDIRTRFLETFRAGVNSIK